MVEKTLQSSKLAIRRYEDGDKKAVINLLEEFIDHIGKLDRHKLFVGRIGYGDKCLKDIVDDVAKRNGIFYVAVKNGKVVGFVDAVIPEKEDSRLIIDDFKLGEIDLMCVSNSHRGEGIGSELLDRAEKYLKDSGCKLIQNGYFAENSEVGEWYKRKGYEVRHISMLKVL